MKVVLCASIEVRLALLLRSLDAHKAVIWGNESLGHVEAEFARRLVDIGDDAAAQHARSRLAGVDAEGGSGLAALVDDALGELLLSAFERLGRIVKHIVWQVLPAGLCFGDGAADGVLQAVGCIAVEPFGRELGTVLVFPFWPWQVVLFLFHFNHCLGG